MNIRRTYRTIKRLFRPRSIVLMYHRISTGEADPWQLGVSPEHFEQHLQVLQRSVDVVSL
jgi:hypothetical protein